METTRQGTAGRRLVGVRDFMEYCGVGRNKAMELGKDIGARVEIGGRVLYDLKKTDAYFDRLTGNGTNTGDKVKAMY